MVKAREEWDAYYREAHSSEATWSNTRLSKLKSLVTQHGLHEITRRLAVLRGSPPSFPPGPWDFDTFARHIDKCTGSRDDNRPATVWLNR